VAVLVCMLVRWSRSSLSEQVRVVYETDVVDPTVSPILLIANVRCCDVGESRLVNKDEAGADQTLIGRLKKTTGSRFRASKTAQLNSASGKLFSGTRRIMNTVQDRHEDGSLMWYDECYCQRLLDSTQVAAGAPPPHLSSFSTFDRPDSY